MCLISNAKIELEAAIVAAFDGVKLEDGIGLYEAQAIDGYADLETRASNRSRDEKEDWKSITNSSLNECNSSVHFFDPKGMRFHLPAFMLCELQGKYLSDLIFLLAHVPVTRTEQFSALSPTQRSAICMYLEFKSATDDDVAWDIPHIDRALSTYWRNPHANPAHNQ